MNEGNNFNQNGVPVQEPVQPIQQPVYQQPVQPEPPKKSSKGIIILLIIIILALIGYIVYDKDLLNLKKEDNTNTSEKGKDKPAEKEIKELSNFSTNKFSSAVHSPFLIPSFKQFLQRSLHCLPVLSWSISAH